MNAFTGTSSGMKPADLFKTRFFRIPSYQRGYAWEQTQWDEFLEDIELLSADAIYFTGTIVLSAASDLPPAKDRRENTYDVFDVMDGQQRLVYDMGICSINGGRAFRTPSMCWIRDSLNACMYICSAGRTLPAVRATSWLATTNFEEM